MSERRTLQERIHCFIEGRPASRESKTIWELMDVHGFRMTKEDRASSTVDPAEAFRLAFEQFYAPKVPVSANIAYPRLQAREEDLVGAQLGTVMDDTPEGLVVRVHIFHTKSSLFAKAWTRLRKWDWVYVKEVK